MSTKKYYFTDMYFPRMNQDIRWLRQHNAYILVYQHKHTSTKGASVCMMCDYELPPSVKIFLRSQLYNETIKKYTGLKTDHMGIRSKAEDRRLIEQIDEDLHREITVENREKTFNKYFEPMANKEIMENLYELYEIVDCDKNN